MGNSVLTRLAEAEVFVFVGGMAAIIALRQITGQINTRNLLWGKRKDGTAYFSAERVQLLLATIAMAMQYLLSAVHAKSGKMPDIPDGALGVLGLSNAIYLGGKGWMMLRDRHN